MFFISILVQSRFSAEFCQSVRDQDSEGHIVVHFMQFELTLHENNTWNMKVWNNSTIFQGDGLGIFIIFDMHCVYSFMRIKELADWLIN